MKEIFDLDKIKNADKEMIEMEKNGKLNSIIVPQLNGTEPAPIKRKRGRPRKNKTNEEETHNVEIVEPELLCQTNDPYEGSYEETNYLLRDSINQINALSTGIHADIDTLRKSKTIKGKYKFIADLSSTYSSLINNKISAIKEINNTTTTCHKLEIQRFKDLKNDESKQDDDKYIADLYNAYINTPINAGQQNASFLNNTANTAIVNQNLMNNAMPSSDNYEDGYQDFLNNMSPEDRRMIMGNNSNIEEVVVYDPSTGSRYFDVIDTNTQTSVPNYPRPDASLLDDAYLDLTAGVASNTNIGQNWKIVIADSMTNF